ncbi:MAG: sugar ABC transporter permease [Chloroflexi bacterium]|nr:MAG: sugar ABC transporter permease [Chloroflexota bacterium]
MLEFILTVLIWALLGGVPGYYVAYVRQYNPRHGVLVGALLGVAVGVFGVGLGAVPSATHAVVMLLELAVIIALLIPRGRFDEQVTARGRIANLAYALLTPTALIVVGVVIFPLIWNIIFSVRPIEVGDLATVQLFDLTDFTLENFDSQMGVRLDIIPCETDENGACLVDDEGEIQYVNPRNYLEGYRRYRAVNEFDLFGQHFIVGVRDREFYPMIWRTFFYTLTSTLLAILFGLIAALIVRDRFPGRAIFRGFILFPYIAPVISVAFIWQVLFSTNGFINGLMGTSTNFLSTRDQFLGIDIPLVMVILFQTWRYFPFAFLFLLARIQAIPEEMYEAAKVDGATPLARLFYITLPQLRAVFGTLFLLRFIWTFNKFDDIYLLTGPISQTKVIPIQIFESLFTNSNIGQASAIAVIMAVILGAVLYIYFRWFLVEEA